VGVTWELVGLTMGLVAVKWNTTDERRVLERVWEWRAGTRAGAQRAAIGGGGKRGALVWFSWRCA
jgi:hypothetical protein